MGYDKNKVSFTDAEHSAAESADQIYETLASAASDGLNLDDLSVLLQILGPGKSLFSYLTGGSKQEFANKLISLGVMLERDNDFLSGTSGE